MIFVTSQSQLNLSILQYLNIIRIIRQSNIDFRIQNWLGGDEKTG